MDKLKIILFGFSLMSMQCLGQNLEFKNFTISDGLPSNQVYYVFKDTRNFIWVCTDLGVARYNGIRFETFTTQDGLADNDIFNCFEDKWGRIWFASANGELSYFENEKFYNEKSALWIQTNTAYGLINHFQQSSSDSSFYIFYLHSGNVYGKIYGNKLHIDSSHRSEQNFDKRHCRLCGLYDDTLYVTINAERKSFGYILNNTLQIIKEKTTSLTQIILANNGKNPLVLLDTQAFDMKSRNFHILTQTNRLASYYRDRNAEYIGSQNGLIIHTSYSDAGVLSKRHITGITKDNYGTLYLSTYRNGLYIAKNMPNSFEPYFNETLAAHLTIGNKSYFADQKGNIFCRENNKVSKINNKPLPKGKIQYFLNWRGHVLKILANNEIFFFTNSDPPIFQPFKKKEKGYKGSNLVFKNELYCLESFSLSVAKPYNQKKIIVPSNTRKRMISLAFDDTSSLWLNTYGQFFEIKNEQTKEVKHLSNLKIDEFNFLKKKLVLINNDNKLLVITNYTNLKSLIKVTPKPFLRFKKLKKINSNSIICRDSKNQNWLLSISDKKPIITELIDEIKRAELSDIFSDENAIYLNQKGRCIRLWNNQITAPNWRPSLHEKNILINGKSISNSEDSHLTCQQGDNISFTYLPISKIDNQLKYEYAVLFNTDTNWKTSLYPSLNLSVPKWGAYTVLFRAKNIAGIYSNIVVHQFNIPAPFYTRWWFVLILLTVIIGGTLFSTSLFRLAQQKKRINDKEVEKKNLLAEFKSLNALMNPHFIFNSLNNIQGFINNDLKDDANNYLHIFSQLVRQNMHNISKGEISLQQELNLVENYLQLEKMRFKEKFEYKIRIDEGIEMDDILVPPLSVQPIVENCIKHGLLPLTNRVGQVIIIVSQVQEQQIEVRVQDNGIGFNNSKNTLGNKLALKNISKRFYMLSQLHEKEYKIQVKNINDKGEFKNAVIIRIPYLG